MPESIRAEGVPPVPASLAAALNRFQNIRSASFHDWDKTGNRAMYITTRFADTPQVHYVAAPGGSRRQLTFHDDRVRDVSARPEHNQFLFEKDEGGAENDQLFLQDRTRELRGGLPTARAATLPRPGHQPVSFWRGAAMPAMAGTWIFTSRPLPTSTFSSRLKEVSGEWTVSDWSPDGTKVLAEEYISINEAYLYIIDIATGQTTTITPRRTDPNAEPVFAGQARWSKDGKSIYYISDEKSEFRRLVKYNVASGTKRGVLLTRISGMSRNSTRARTASSLPESRMRTAGPVYMTAGPAWRTTTPRESPRGKSRARNSGKGLRSSH